MLAVFRSVQVSGNGVCNFSETSVIARNCELRLVRGDNYDGRLSGNYDGR